MSIKRGPTPQVPAPDPEAVDRFLTGAKTAPAVAPPPKEPWKEIKGEVLTQVNLRLPVEMAEKLHYLAKMTGRQKQAIVAEALGPWLDERVKGPSSS